MEARELLLPLLIAFAGAVIRGALFAQPPNVTYIIDKGSCNLQVKWLPPSSNCTQAYMVATRIDGNWDARSVQCLEDTFWNPNVPLGKKIAFGIQTFCQGCKSSPWNDDEAFHVVQNGAAGSRARDVNCTWWNRNYMKCLWRAGENASPDTSYRLFYWHDSLNKEHQCGDLTREGSVFRCGFELSIQHVQLIAISIQGNSEHIQPMCLLLDSINNLVKLDPPAIIHLSKSGSEVFLNWTGHAFSDLEYEVEVDSEQEPRHFKDITSATIPVEPDVRHTFRVRLKSKEGQWSDWSDVKVLDGTTSTSLLLLFLISLSVALLFIILLIYLKRIKLLILPKIPDPEKILKHMFEEQNENQPIHETARNEETHSLMIVEPARNEK